MQNTTNAAITTTPTTRKEKSELVDAQCIIFSDTTVQKLDALSAKREAWEKGIFKKANEALYELLGETLDLYYTNEVIVQGTNIPAHGKAYMSNLRKELTKRLKALDVKVQGNSKTISMLVRYVFKSDRKRAKGYSQVLEAALKDNVQPADLPAYITSAGGVEMIKRRMVVSPKALERREQVSIAKVSVQSDIEHASLNPLATAKIVAEGEYTVLLAKPRPDGHVDIVGVVPEVNQALWNALLLRIAKNRAEQGAIDPVGTMTNVFDVSNAANDPAVAIHA